MSQNRTARTGTNVTVRLDTELLNDIDKCVRRDRGVISRATWIRQAILSRLETEQQAASTPGTKR